jgi:hypothetical protein
LPAFFGHVMAQGRAGAGLTHAPASFC